MSGGGGGGAPAPEQPTHTTQTITQNTTSDVPSWAKPFYTDMLRKSKSLSEEAYTPFPGQRLTQDSADLLGSQQMVRSIAGSPIPGFGQAAGMMGGLGGMAMGLGQQQPGQFGASPFQQTGVSPFGGFQQTGADPYSGFQATRGQEFGGFQAGQASPFADFQAGQFQQTGVSPFGDFRQTQVTPFSDFQATRGQEFGGFQAGQVSPFANFQEGQAEAFAFDPAQQFTGQSVDQYMSPYMDSVVGRQQEDAIEQFERQRAARDARAVTAGAFGGSRQAVQEGLAEEALGRQLGDIRATGSQQAFEQAQQQFERDRSAQMAQQQAQAQELARVQGISVEEAARVQQSQAQELARTQGISVEEAARVQAGNVAEQGRVQQARAQELARTQGINIEEAARIQQATAAERARLQAMDADEFARVQQSQAAELARTQGISIDEAARVQAAQAQELARTQGISVEEAARVQAGNASEQARVQQARADESMRQREFQLQSMGFTADMAREIASLGERARQGDIQAAQLLEAQGLGQMARDQAGLDIAYQDFLRQQNFPRQQLADYSATLRGLPVADVGTSGGTTATTQPGASPLQQALGLGISGLGLYRGLMG